MGNKRVAIVVVAAIAATLGQSHVAQANHDDPCGDVTLVFARGSGQVLNELEASAFFDKVQERIDSEELVVTEYELGTEDHGGALYDPVDGLLNYIEGEWSWTDPIAGDYRDSVAAGVTELTTYLAGRASACPDEVFVLGGYSQGAHVLGDALFEVPESLRDRILYTAMFGDPKLYLPYGGGIFPAACRGQAEPWRRGSVRCWKNSGILDARIPYIPADMEDRTGSWCDDNDGICTDSIPDWIAYPDHNEYADDGAEIDEASREIAMALDAYFPEPHRFVTTWFLNPGIYGNDIAFVIDTTGSMTSRINAAKTLALDMADRVVNCPNILTCGRVSLVEYRDAGDAFVSRVVQPFTTDTEDFAASVNGLTAGGGGDTPEALLHALMTTITDLDWPDVISARKTAVVITDAGYHDPDVAGGYTLADVRDAALALDPLNVYPVVTSGLASTYAPLAQDTSGEVVIDSGDTVAALEAALGAIESQPVARLGIYEYFAEPGETVTFDASNSTDDDSEITSYDWDFEGDGIYDTTTTVPTASHVYNSSFDGLAEVRVHSADGGVANAIAFVKVDTVGLSGLRPGAPTNVTSETVTQAEATRTVRLSWNPAATGPDATSWVVRTSDGLAVGGLAAADTTFDITNAPLDELEFTVEAVNEYGPSEATSVVVPASGDELQATLVVGSPTLTASDTLLEGRLEALDFEVTILDDSDAAPIGQDVIVVAASATVAELGSKFRNVATPVVTFAQNLQQDGFINGGGASSANATSAYVRSPAHGASGSLEGQQTVFATSKSVRLVSLSLLGSGAQVVLAESSVPTSAAVTIAYDEGAARPGTAGNAPARRFAWSLPTASLAALNANGITFVDAAISWAALGDDPPL